MSYKVIPLRTVGKEAIVDQEDYDALCPFAWYAQKNSSGIEYAFRFEEYQGKRRKVYMHRQILGLLPGSRNQVDHINDIGLDNRRENLRPITVAQNQHKQRVQNRKQEGQCASVYKGVCYDKGRWRAKIRYGGIRLSLGSFSTEVEAALAYDEAARLIYGKFARPNFPITGDKEKK